MPCLHLQFYITYVSEIQFIIEQVFDEAGNDVTPLPLNPVDPNALRRNQSNILGDGSVGTVR